MYDEHTPTCPHCGAITDAAGLWDGEDDSYTYAVPSTDDIANAQQWTTRRARELQQADPSLALGDALRVAARELSTRQANAQAATRHGAVDSSAALTARAERVQRREGLSFAEALRRVMGDPTMRRLTARAERGR